MRILMLVGVLLLSQACVVVPVRRPGMPPPPPSSSRPMNYNEAVALGMNFCRSRRYDCQLQEAHMAGNDVWKVKFRAFGYGGAKGHVHLDYQAYSRELLRVDEKVKVRKGDWDDDDDHDDHDDHGHGHGRH
jgi:hypothetical protein